MRKGTLKKALALALTGAVLVGAFAGCGAKKDSGDKKETKKIVIGATPSATSSTASSASSTRLSSVVPDALLFSVVPFVVESFLPLPHPVNTTDTARISVNKRLVSFNVFFIFYLLFSLTS